MSLHRLYATTAALLFVFAATSVPIGSSAKAAQRAIDQIRVSSGAAESRVRITFNTVMRYVSHSPKDRGNVLVIELRRVLMPGSRDEEFELSARGNVKPTRQVPISEIRLEADRPEAPRLIVSFTKRVRFRVQGARNMRSIDIFLVNERRQPRRPSARPVPPKPERRGKRVAATPARNLSGEFVVNLASSRTPFVASKVPRLAAFANYRLYSYPLSVRGKIWHRLRLGFFRDRASAKALIKNLPAQFADAWVARAGKGEKARSAGLKIDLGFRRGALRPAGRSQRRKPAVPRGKLPRISDKRLTRIWEEAKNAMTRRAYSRAVQLYTKLLQLPDHRYTQQSLEFLGLARERKGQLAHAKAEYEKYLELYPKGESAERVKQRLAGILTTKADPKRKLAPGKRLPDKSRWRAQLYGGFSQFYNYRERKIEPEKWRKTQSDLFTDLNLTTRLSSDRFDLRTLFVGGNTYSFFDRENFGNSRISSMYFDARDRDTGLSTRIGRQTLSSGGVLGRFDGARLSYQVIPQFRLNLVGGLPVESARSTDIDTDRYFYGASIDLGPFGEAWNINLFAINQIVDEILDRRAVGGEVRYVKDRIAAFALVDYDISYDELNIALLNGTIIFKNRTSLNLALSYRNSPVLTTYNALQGQGVESISVLLNRFDEDEIRQLAKDRTAKSQSGTLGISQPLDDQFQISADVTATKLSHTDASGGVPATEGTDYEFYYSTHVTGTSLLAKGDVHIFGLRFADTDRSETATATLNFRYPIGRRLRINPRLRSDYRFGDDRRGNRIRISPTLRINVRWPRWAYFEVEGGGEWTSEEFVSTAVGSADNTLDTYEWFIRAGYRFDF